MKCNKTKLFIFFILLTNSCFAQKKGYDYKNPCHPGDTLFEKETFTKFVADSSGRFIIALDTKGNILWKTNPWNNQYFKTYDSSMSDSKKQNKIVSFFLTSIGKTRKQANFIMLDFASSPVAAVIDKRNGNLQIIGVK
jgi:hypothetical protein